MSKKNIFYDFKEWCTALFLNVNDLDQINENELPADETKQMEEMHENGIWTREKENAFRKKYDRVGTVGEKIAQRDAHETEKRIKEAEERAH